MKWIILTIVCGLILLSGCTAPPQEEQEADAEEVADQAEEPTEQENVTDEEPAENETAMGDEPPAEPAQYMDVSPEEAKALIDSTPDLIIIDVSPAYDDGHLPGAVHYYLGDGSLDEAIPTLDKTKPYLVYCHVDSVAIQGAQKLIDAGFDPVYRLEGNYGAWVDAGYPVEK